MKYEKTLFSIIINNYNYGKFLTEAIESALAQTYPNTEIIVVDDGSTDNSREIIHTYEEKIIPVLKENGGQASAFNAGFKASKGEIICFLDADDYYLPEKATQIVELFEQYPNAGWIFHNLEKVDIKGCPLKIPDKRCINKFEYVDLRDTILHGKLLDYWFPATSGLCFKRDIIKNILPMPEQFLISGDAFLRLATIHLSPGVLSPEKFAIHRSHGNNFYEFKKNIGVDRSKLYIKVAYYLRKRFPEIYNFTDNLLANSLVQLINYTSFKEALQLPEYQAYLEHCPPLISSLNLTMKIIFTYAKIQGKRVLNTTFIRP
ncbi:MULTISPECIES: glycosyltransferase family 2 protein [unclassified Coleofasciculus]|uniref:glycosyltransferase family 2 protein n=1 Tax=unclassified Coleofasciculus TaxID=2692782 RepID=UPI0018829913|nr:MULTISPECIES: glycosyltransferase [unclassified Coleofasciculus]MBE9126805.1 glycosyltransferase [Coleofasciculus sp. LEGE 07081]MBE9150176.1 glycosyltransferase [Coleofasciculus sp. LEGE 07092]